MALPQLHAKAAYLTINNAAKRNALSLTVLRDLRSQLIKHNTSPVDQQPRFLPPFKPSILHDLEKISHSIRDERSDKPSHNPDKDNPNLAETCSLPTSTSHTPDFDLDEIDQHRRQDLSWLLSTTEFNKHRANLPRALILRTPGPIFSSGHDLRELSRLSDPEIKETFRLCAQVMRLIRRSPIPIVSVIQPNQLATAAGAQLALSTDMTVAHASAALQLPGQSIGIPCTSPSTILSRSIGSKATFRMLLTAEPVKMDELFGASKSGAVEVVGHHDDQSDSATNILNQRVDQIVTRIVDRSASLPQALGKWAFWAQFSLNGSVSVNGDLEDIDDGAGHSKSGASVRGSSGRQTAGMGADGCEDAVDWTGRMMALHAQFDDAKEGISSFLEKRPVSWKT